MLKMLVDETLRRNRVLAVNWSRGGGDLRVAHFVGMHALQILPLLGWSLARRGAPAARRWVQFATFAFAALTGLLVVEALAGKPVLAFALVESRQGGAESKLAFGARTR
ncbi:MAG: hypothetical protein ABIV11_00410 [Gemmatimonadaceae bacterium]